MLPLLILIGFYIFISIKIRNANDISKTTKYVFYFFIVLGGGILLYIAFVFWLLRNTIPKLQLMPQQEKSKEWFVRSYYLSSLCSKTSSIETPKASAILKANSKDGVYLYFSIDITACREIPTLSAKSACVQSLSALSTLILFHIKVISPFQNVMK